jgi:hypothetical protein
MLLGIVGTLGLVGLTGCGPAAAATSQAMSAKRSGVWVEVTPGTTTAGFKVSVKADCGDNSNTAIVNSAAFGQLTLQPSSTLLTAEVLIPPTTKAGRFDVTISCKTGASATSSLTIIAATTPAPTVGPHTGGGFLAGTDEDNDFTGPAAWLAGSAGALALAGTVGAVSVRRRRRSLVGR